jgi:hypothetical protein
MLMFAWQELGAKVWGFADFLAPDSGPRFEGITNVHVYPRFARLVDACLRTLQRRRLWHIA